MSESETTPSLPSVDSDLGSIDSDSAIDGTSIRTSTASLRSSIFEYIEENGRTYHRYKEGKYPLPNDEREQERLDLQHALFGVTLSGKLSLAPIKPDLHHVLDIATGTGIWAIEFATDHPSANVLGTDLSPIQPPYVPPNCRFQIDDAEDEWTFSHKFDYVHGRALLTCFKDPSRVIQMAFDALEPGGYLELQDGCLPFQYIGEPPKDSALYKWNEAVVAGGAELGRPWTNVQHYRRWMEDTGFEDVVEKSFYWPTNLLHGLEGISLRVMGAIGWSVEEIQAFLPGVRDDIKNTSIHAFLPIKIVYGRKPGGALRK